MSSCRPFRLALPLLLLAACGGDESTAPKPFSHADARSLLLAFAPEMLRGMSANIGSSGPAATQTVACPRGGSVRVSVAAASGNGAVITIVHLNCRVDGPEGRTWTVDGDPDLRVEIGPVTMPTKPGGEASGSVSTIGALHVSDGNTSGRCAIDTELEWRASTTTSPTVVMHYTGKVCGVDVDETLTGPIT